MRLIRSIKLMRDFRVELSAIHTQIVESFFTVDVETFLCGTSVCSAIYKLPQLSLELACFADAKYMLALLNHPGNRELYAIKDIQHDVNSDKMTLKLDEAMLAQQERSFTRSDLNIVIYCLPYKNKKAAFERLCQQQGDNTMLFYDFKNEKVLDVAGHFKTIAVYPRLYLDPQFNVAPILDIISRNPGHGADPPFICSM